MEAEAARGMRVSRRASGAAHTQGMRPDRQADRQRAGTLTQQQQHVYAGCRVAPVVTRHAAVLYLAIRAAAVCFWPRTHTYTTRRYVATAGADRVVKVWDLQAGFCTHSFTGHR
jgi:WD40 repeat protein